jgi:hypothetical protein
MKSTKRLSLATLALAAPAANAAIVLYSSSFGGSSGTNLNGTAVTTSGATGAQHTQYGTNISATWSAHTKFKANGSYVEAGTNNSPTDNNRNSATIVFTPQNGYVYNLLMTTSFTQVPVAAFHAVGFFETSGYTGNINSTTGADVWALTRPGDPLVNLDQTAHYNVIGGAGNIGAGDLDTTGPSTLRITLDTTLGAGNWAATYYVGDGSGGFNLLGSVADLNAVTIGSVGIGVFNGDGVANFQSFELSVIPEPSAALLGSLGFLALLRRRR